MKTTDRWIAWAHRRIDSEEGILLDLLFSFPPCVSLWRVAALGLDAIGIPQSYGFLLFPAVFGLGSLLFRGRDQREKILLYWLWNYAGVFTGLAAAIVPPLVPVLSGSPWQPDAVALAGFGFSFVNVVLTQIYHRISSTSSRAR